MMLLLVGSQVFVNCGDDDSPAPPSEEFTRLLGVWEVDQVLVQGQDPVFDPSCMDQLRLEFREDGTFTETTFAGENPSECTEAVNRNGEWQSTGGDVYQRTFVGGQPMSVTYTFVDNDSKFTFDAGANKRLVFEKK